MRPRAISCATIARIKYAALRWNTRSEAKRRELTAGHVDLPWDALSAKSQFKVIKALGVR